MSNHYSQQFKDEAVALAIESEGPYRQIAEDVGVNYKSFGNWMSKAMSNKPSGNTKSSVNKQNYQTLERELRATRKELDTSLLATPRALGIVVFTENCWNWMTTKVLENEFVSRCEC